MYKHNWLDEYTNCTRYAHVGNRYCDDIIFTEYLEFATDKFQWIMKQNVCFVPPDFFACLENEMRRRLSRIASFFFNKKKDR